MARSRGSFLVSLVVPCLLAPSLGGVGAVGLATNLRGCRGSISFGEHEPIGTIEEARALEEGVTRVRVRNNVGDVIVKVVEAREVRVKAEVSHRAGWGKSSPTADAARDLLWKREGDALTVGNAHLDASDADDWHMDLVVAIPSGLHLRVDNGVGDTDVEGLGGDLLVDVGVGDVSVRGRAASFEIKSGVGDVEVTIEDASTSGRLSSGVGDARVTLRDAVPSGGLEVESGTGDVAVTIPAGAKADLDLQTRVGDVSVPDGANVTEESAFVSGSARGTLGGGGPRIRLKTGVGDVRLRT